MSKKFLRDDFSYDDDLTLQLREKQIDVITHSNYPKIGKINLANFNFDKLKVKYIKEEINDSIPNNIKHFIDEEQNIIILKDGNIIYNNLDKNFENLEITTYFSALKNNNEEALTIFKRNFISEENNKFLNINAAYQNSALLIKIPKNIVIKEAVKLYIVGEKSDLVHHTYIFAENSSEFTLVEKLDNLHDVNVNFVSEVFVNENAKVNYIGIDRLSENSNAFVERQGYVKQDGSLIYALGQLNDGNTVSNNIVKLLGKNAYCESRNVLFTDKESVHAVTVNIEHFSPYSVGNITNHGIVKDKGVLHVDGIGKINQGMSHSNSLQKTNIITLSDEAKVNANPYLLIDEYDVMAGHGAGIGKVDDEQLYYLMSRGLTKKAAEKLIILGFLYPIIELINSDKIKESFIKTIENKLSI